ncbi:MAG TPA: MFS transporter [Actinomycetota bacterium]|nr:MFS transporter [Actinomycetota bacterium]
MEHRSRSARSAIARLAIARAISITGGAAAFTALMFAVYERTGRSTLWLSAALLVTFGVHGVLGWFAGALGDRFDRRKVLIASDLAGAAVYVVMVGVDDPGALLVFGFLAAVAEAPFISSSSAAVPALVDRPEDVDRANSWISVGTSAGIFVGPAVGGIVLDAVGVGVVFAANAVTFGVSALLVWSIRRPFARTSDEDHDDHRGVLAGLRYIRREPVLARITVAFTIMVAFIGLVMVADLPLVELFARDDAETGRLYGFLIAAWGLGSAVGALAGRVITGRTELRWLVATNLGFAVMMGLVGVSPWFWPVLLFLALNGGFDAMSIVAIRGIQQRRAPDAVRSRVMASTDALWNLGVAFGYAVAGPLVAAIGPRALYVSAGTGALIGTWVLLPLWRRDPAAVTSDEAAVAGDAPRLPRFTSAEDLEAAPAGVESGASAFGSR